ncbi:MAG: FadR/GntR family transcriptional regulator [Desulfuromonadales bacterium]|nr:FadR/GntR family transcriptional regulator [Desulfuromonadales bacterium]
MAVSTKTKHEVRNQLARQIIEGTLRADEVLPNELDLARDYGVSRTTIRDVLQSLEEKGLLERKTYRGTRVRSIHSWNLLDEEVLNWSCGIMTQRRFFSSLMELRLIIEPQAAALAAIRNNDLELQAIQSSFDWMNINDQSIDPEGDVAFHQSIIKASGNMFVAQFGGAIRAALHHTIYLSGKEAIDQVQSIENHRQLLHAIENHDARNAYHIMGRILKLTVADLGLPESELILADI